MARRQEARTFGNLENLWLGMFLHAALGVLYAQVGNPVAEGHIVHRVDIFRQVGAIGAQAVRKVLER